MALKVVIPGTTPTKGMMMNRRVTVRYTRKKLIEICELASVPQDSWLNRDSASAQRQVGECLMLLKAGCAFDILYERPLHTNDHTVWVNITFKGFSDVEYGRPASETDHFYLPTKARMKMRPGDDWY